MLWSSFNKMIQPTIEIKKTAAMNGPRSLILSDTYGWMSYAQLRRGARLTEDSRYMVTNATAYGGTVKSLKKSGGEYKF
jgi:hypothetical protein